MFACYLEPQATVHSIALRLTRVGILTPTGKPRWNVASVRGILKNPAYTGTAYGNRTRIVPATQRKSALLPVGPGFSYRYRPREEWIGVPVPALVSLETFDRVQEKLARNQQCSARNNTHFPYLLRALVSCGRCRLGTTARTMTPSDHDAQWAGVLRLSGTQQRLTPCPRPALYRPLHPRSRPRRPCLAGSVHAPPRA
jgi:site-specific DNA recombinase